MTIRSSTFTQRWTNRERLDKEQDSRDNDSCCKGEQNDRFPARISASAVAAKNIFMGSELGGGEGVMASSMNKSSSYPFLQSAIKRT